jgi:hypothetical protein
MTLAGRLLNAREEAREPLPPIAPYDLGALWWTRTRRRTQKPGRKPKAK